MPYQYMRSGSDAHCPVTSDQCHGPTPHAYAMSNASWTAFPEYRVNIDTVQCHGRRVGSRLETQDAGLESFQEQ